MQYLVEKSKEPVKVHLMGEIKVFTFTSNFEFKQGEMGKQKALWCGTLIVAAPAVAAMAAATRQRQEMAVVEAANYCYYYQSCWL